MREYLVSELKGNEILAKPVCLENGSIILEIGTVLKVSYKESLTALNIQKIFIEDPFERYENVNFYFKQNIFLKFENDLKEIFEIINKRQNPYDTFPEEKKYYSIDEIMEIIQRLGNMAEKSDSSEK